MLYRKIIQHYPCAVICLHHTGKGAEDRTPSKNSMLGSQGIEATARVVLELRRQSGHKRGLTILKGNYTPDSVKEVTYILEFDPEKFILVNTTEVIPISKSLNQIVGVIYKQKAEISKRLVYLKDEDSCTFEAARIILVNEFGDTEVAKLSQLKTWYHEFKDSQSETLDN